MVNDPPWLTVINSSWLRPNFSTAAFRSALAAQ